jgi:hypothetical protein
MKPAEHTEHIRQLIDQAFRNRLGRMGIHEKQLSPLETVPNDYRAERQRMESIREVFIAETSTLAGACEKLVEELNFTLFNRLAALKVMEAHTLHPEIITRRDSHGGRSFAHLACPYSPPFVAHRHWGPDTRSFSPSRGISFRPENDAPPLTHGLSGMGDFMPRCIGLPGLTGYIPLIIKGLFHKSFAKYFRLVFRQPPGRKGGVCP